MMEKSDVVKSTPLVAEHEALHAKMVNFAGWNMPVQYEHGILFEHQHTREKCSLFDICHMGEFNVKGAGVAAALDRIVARPVEDQPIGSCRYNLLLNDEGGILDDLILYRRAEESFFIVVNAGCIDGDAARFQSLLPAGISFENSSDKTAKLDLQGPESINVLCEIWDLSQEDLPSYFHFIEIERFGVRVIVSRTGYTGELGFELYLPADSVVFFWRQFLAHKLVEPAGLGARDTLRLEAGLPLYGHEMSTDISPLETGYGKMLQLKKHPEREFSGKDGVQSRVANRQLCALYLEGRRAAREHTEVRNGIGQKIGIVTSGCYAPSLGKAIALAYLEKDLIPEDQVVFLPLGRGEAKAHIGTMPFYKNGSVKGK